MAAFARTELDALVALARSGAQAAVQVFAVRDGQADRAATCTCSRRPSDVGDDEVLAGSCSSTTARSTIVPPPGPASRRSPADTADLEAFLADRRGHRVRLLVPARGEKRRLVDLAGRNAADFLAREQARWLADEGKTLARPRGAGRGAGPRRPAAADRVLRHLDDPGPGDRRQHGRVRGREAAERRLPPLPDQGRSQGQDDFASHAEMLRRRLHRTPGGRGGDRRGAALDAARPRSSSTAARASWPPTSPSCEELGLGEHPDRRPGQGARGALPARSARSRSSCRRPRRPSTSSSGFATRPTDSPSPTTATCDRKAAVRSAFDDLPGVGPARTPGAAADLRIRQARPRGAARAGGGVPGIGPVLAARIKAHLEA